MSATNGNENGDENGNGNGNSNIHFRKKDGVEKDGYICFPLETPLEKVEEEVVDEKPPSKFELQTCPEDPRYQQMNKTNWCYRMYIDYHRCRHLLGDSASQCDYFYKCYNSICPVSWHERWDEQLKEGRFPRDITRDMPARPAAPCP